MRARNLIPLLSVATIFFGVRYAIGREQLRSPDHLHALYQKTNGEFFDSKLPDVALEVEDLSNDNAEGETYMMNDRFVVVLDPKWNTSESEALDTMRHESCHVATWDVTDPKDPHGPPFQECMKRFE